MCEQTNILLCGSPRVGKSTLINAICQQKLTKTNASLQSADTQIDRYSYEYRSGEKVHETVIYDTPGIESWDENQVRLYMSHLIEETHPLCMIYCASPGSFARLDHVAWLLSECHKKQIFCALVCTNMWSGRNREEVVDEFCRLVETVHSNIQKETEDNVIYFDRVALVTMVNSEEYVDHDFGISKPISGVDELLYAIAKCLNRDLMLAWFRSLAYNKSFWSKMSSKLSTLLQTPVEKFFSVYNSVTNFFDTLFVNHNSDTITTTATETTPETITALETATPTQTTLETITALETTTPTKTTLSTAETATADLFHGVEMIEMQCTKLLFKFKQQNDSAELTQILCKFDSKSSAPQKSDEQLFTITAEFENGKDALAISRFCELANNNMVRCSILNE